VGQHSTNIANVLLRDPVGFSPSIVLLAPKANNFDTLRFGHGKLEPGDRSVAPPNDRDAFDAELVKQSDDVFGKLPVTEGTRHDGARPMAPRVHDLTVKALASSSI
jgi:hypothetical protein